MYIVKRVISKTAAYYSDPIINKSNGSLHGLLEV